MSMVAMGRRSNTRNKSRRQKTVSESHLKFIKRNANTQKDGDGERRHTKTIRETCGLVINGAFKINVHLTFFSGGWVLAIFPLIGSQSCTEVAHFIGWRRGKGV